MLIAPTQPTHDKLMFVMRQSPVDLEVDRANHSAYKEALRASQFALLFYNFALIKFFAYYIGVAA